MDVQLSRLQPLHGNQHKHFTHAAFEVLTNYTFAHARTLRFFEALFFKESVLTLTLTFQSVQSTVH